LKVSNLILPVNFADEGEKQSLKGEIWEPRTHLARPVPGLAHLYIVASPCIATRACSPQIFSCQRACSHNPQEGAPARSEKPAFYPCQRDKPHKHWRFAARITFSARITCVPTFALNLVWRTILSPGAFHRVFWHSSQSDLQRQHYGVNC
jgi:hypothetical protein